MTQQPKVGHEERLTVRIPSAQFDGAVAAFAKLGELQYQNLGVEDITKAYFDLETRLALKEQTLTRLRGMLDNRTAKLSDVLDVERESNRVIEEIETLKGERRFYDQQVAMSTLVITFTKTVLSRAGSSARQSSTHFSVRSSYSEHHWPVCCPRSFSARRGSSHSGLHGGCSENFAPSLNHQSQPRLLTHLNRSRQYQASNH